MKQVRVPTRARVCPRLFLWMTILAAVAPGAWGQSDALAFSETRLREGEQAYLGRRYPDAVDQFRIAAFCLLDHPVLLSQALVMLSLSQDSAGRRDEARATVARLADVERRFPSYAKARIDPAVRADFEARFRKSFPDLFVRGAQPGGAGPAQAPSAEPAR